MQKVIILIVLMISSLFAGDHKSLTLDKARALIAKADTVLSQQFPVQELGSYTMVVLDPVTGQTFKVTKSPPAVIADDGKTSTAMLLK
jgi:hypothetical protein